MPAFYRIIIKAIVSNNMINLQVPINYLYEKRQTGGFQ